MSVYFADDRCCDRSAADGGARFDPEALPLQLAPVAAQQGCGGFLHPAAALLQRVLRPRAFEVFGRGRHRLVDPNDDLGWLERPL